MRVAEQSEADFAELVSQRLAAVEDRLHEVAVAGTPFVTEAARHVVHAGGKRFRPALVVAASMLYPGADVEDVIRAAVVVELTHVASLYHDDVMDEADTRRGVPTANRRWDNSVAILVGDYLFARASSVVASLGVDYVALQAETFSRLVQGQIAETRGVQPGDDPMAHYLTVVADKTGSLIATSAVFGGMVCGAPPEVLHALAAFGEEIGVVFQLSDDVIDLVGVDTGKGQGTDLREGVLTLPTLIARRSTDPADARLLDLLGGEIDDPDDLAEALDLMRRHAAVTEARAEIARRAEVARGWLAALPAGPARDALGVLCDQVVTRTA